MQINQTGIDPAVVKQDKAYTSASTLNAVDANNMIEGIEQQQRSATIVTLSNGSVDAPVTYEFGNGPGKPPP